MTSCSNCGYTAEAAFNFCPACGTKSVGESESLIGTTLNDKYRVLSQIGSGGMGTVYLGEHIGLKKRVALKILHPDLHVSEESLQRFQREGIAAGKFNHPNAIQIFDFDRSKSGTFYLAMEFIEGPNLKAFLAKRGRLAPAVAAEIIAQVLSALAQAHENGIIHRDLKPDNIMVMEGSGGALSVKVLDFGLSKLVDVPMSASLQTQAGRLLGTPLYMAPEQCSGEETDERSDLYAVGLILYELLTGITAFPDVSTTEILFTRPQREAPSLSASHPDLGFPPALDALIQRALQRRREDRFASAAEMLAALQAVRGSVDTRASSTSTQPLAPLPRPDESAVASASAAGAADAASEADGGGGRRIPRRTLAIGIALLAVAVTVFLTDDAGDPTSASLVSQKPEGERTNDEFRYVVALEQAERDLERGQWSDALTLAQDAIGMPCADAEAYLVRARAYRGRGELDIARADLDEAVERAPGYAAAYLERGWLELEADELDAAETAFGSALESEPASAPASTGLGATLRRRGERGQARERLEQAVAADPGFAAAREELGELLIEEGDLDGAYAMLLEARRASPDSWRAGRGLARIAIARDDEEAAIRYLRDALAEQSDLIELRRELASLLIASGALDEARRLIDEGLRAGDDADLLLLSAAALEIEGDADGAIRATRAALRQRPDDAAALTLLGTLYHGAGRVADAVDTLSRASQLDPRSGLARLQLGLALFELGRIDEAATELEAAVRLEPEDAYARLSFGVLCMEYLDRPDEALEHFTTYQDLDGSDPRVDRWIRQLDV